MKANKAKAAPLVDLIPTTGRTDDDPRWQRLRAALELAAVVAPDYFKEKTSRAILEGMELVVLPQLATDERLRVALEAIRALETAGTPRWGAYIVEDWTYDLERMTRGRRRVQ